VRRVQIPYNRNPVNFHPKVRPVHLLVQMNDSDIDSDYQDDNNMQSRKRSHAGINQLIEAIQELDVGNETDESDDDSEFDTNIPIILAARAAGTMLVSLFDVDDVHNDSPVIPDFLDASLFTFLLQTSDGVTLEYIGDVEEQEENAYDDDEYSNDSNNDDEYDEHGILFDSQLDRRFNHHQYYSEDFVVAGCTVPADDSIPPTAECAIKFLKLCQDRNVLSTLLKFGVHYFEQNNSFCFQSVVFDLTSKFHKGGNTDLIWELNIFLPSYFCIKKSDLIRPNYNGFVRDDNGTYIHQIMLCFLSIG
jgi:hypothetical protein